MESDLCDPGMIESVHLGVFDHFSGPIVSLKTYDEYNNQMLLPELSWQQKSEVMEPPEVKSTGHTIFLKSNMEITSTNTKNKLTSLIKSSYHTYIPLAISQKIDCCCRPCQNCPSHSHIITLIEHALDSNNALFFVCII